MFVLFSDILIKSCSVRPFVHLSVRPFFHVANNRRGDGDIRVK